MTLFAGSIFDGTANVNNIAAGTPILADVALAVPMTSKPQGFGVGTNFWDWVEYGFRYADEESTVSLPVGATVRAEQ
jgi:hypothetical protein